MKKELHPKTFDVTAHCACGHEFKTTSTRKEIRTSLCSNCHPLFTGEQKYVDTAGRIEKFKKKFEAAAAKNKEAKAVAEAPKAEKTEKKKKK